MSSLDHKPHQMGTLNYIMMCVNNIERDVHLCIHLLTLSILERVFEPFSLHPNLCRIVLLLLCDNQTLLYPASTRPTLIGQSCMMTMTSTGCQYEGIAVQSIRFLILSVQSFLFCTEEMITMGDVGVGSGAGDSIPYIFLPICELLVLQQNCACFVIIVHTASFCNSKAFQVFHLNQGGRADWMKCRTRNIKC